MYLYRFDRNIAHSVNVKKKKTKRNRKKKHFILATKTYNFKRIMYLYVCKLNEKRNPTYTLYNTYLDISYRMWVYIDRI